MNDSRIIHLLQVYYREADGTVIAAPGVLYATVDRTAPPFDEVAPDAYCDGYLLQAATDESVWGHGATRGQRQVQNAAFVVNNPGGELDVWRSRSVHGCSCVLYRMHADGTPEEGTVIDVDFTGVLELVEVADDTVTFHARDQSFMLLRQPALSKRYAGTNVLPSGQEGTADDIKGQSKPWVLGYVFNFAPPCVNTALHIYEIDGEEGLRTGWSLVGRDAGFVLTQEADYADVADMEANAPTAGAFRVLAGSGFGYVRLGAKPTGQLTFDVLNPAAYSTTAPNKTRLRALVEDLAAKSSGHSPGHASNMPPALGIVVKDGMTLMDAINTLITGCGSGWSCPAKIVFFAVSDPGAYVAGTFDEINEDNVAVTSGKTSLRQVVTNDSDRGIPAWRVVVRYHRNYTVQTGTQISASVAAADATAYAQEWRVASAADPAVKTRWPNAPEIVIDSCIWLEADAQTLADTLLAIYKVQRGMFVCDVQLDPDSDNEDFAYTVGTTKMLKHPRYELSAGLAVKVVGRRFNIDRRTISLTLWG